MESENKAIFRAFYERAWNYADVTMADELLAEEFTNHEIAGPTSVSHRALYKQAIAENFAALPDWQLVLDSLIEEGDVVAARWHAWGKHTGEAWGIAPTGKVSAFSGMTMVRLAHGKITDFWKHDGSLAGWRELDG